MQETKTIFLIGFMGAGKTSVGRLLAQQLGRPFIDTDQVIEKRQSQSIAALFNQQGEAAFRQIEHEVLLELASFKGVIATGGGIVERADNRQFLAAHPGQVILLAGSFAQTVAHLVADETRPLVQTRSIGALAALWKQRRPYYAELAKTVVDTTDLTVAEIAGALASYVRQDNSPARLRQALANLRLQKAVQQRKDLSLLPQEEPILAALQTQVGQLSTLHDREEQEGFFNDC